MGKRIGKARIIREAPWASLKGGSQAVFKAKVVSGFRITIPDVERELLGIKEGDYVWVLLEKIGGSSKRDELK